VPDLMNCTQKTAGISFFSQFLTREQFGTLQHVQVADINFHLGGLYSSLCGRVYILTLLRNAEGSKLQRNA